MMRPIVALLLLTCPAHAAPQDAVVRISSHGGSGTVIATGDGWSLILSCRHLFTDRHGAIDKNMLAKPLTFDVPWPEKATPGRGGSRVLAYDTGGADLSLMLLSAGPLPYVCPPAPKGFRPRECLSVGYDRQEFPPKMRPANITHTGPSTTWTREVPWHGRSGGALIDRETGYLVGVVSAYSGSVKRTDGGKADYVPGVKGVYASHAAIVTFLEHQGYRVDALTYREPRRDELPSPAPLRPSPKVSPPRC